MPMFTTSLSQQLQAAGAGSQFYPLTSSLQKGIILGDTFDRETLTPTGAYTLYTVTSNDGSGTAAIISATRLELVTDLSAAGDDVSVRTSGIYMPRITVSDAINQKSMFTLDIVFKLNEITNTEGFIGLHVGGGALSALPTTAAHMGLFWDASAQANFRFTSAENTTQSNNDTTEALSTSVYRLRIIWNGKTSNTIELYSGTSPAINTLVSSITSTTTPNSENMQLHFFVQTEALEAKTLIIHEWKGSVQ